jgi:ketosteroid isomerase-like protein
MSQKNVEIVRRYYSAWNEGGIDAARAFWSEEIEWHDAPDMPDSGIYRGAESVAAHFREPRRSAWRDGGQHRQPGPRW